MSKDLLHYRKPCQKTCYFIENHVKRLVISPDANHVLLTVVQTAFPFNMPQQCITLILVLSTFIHQFLCHFGWVFYVPQNLSIFISNSNNKDLNLRLYANHLTNGHLHKSYVHFFLLQVSERHHKICPKVYVCFNYLFCHNHVSRL